MRTCANSIWGWEPVGTRRLIKLCLWGSGGVLRDVCAGIRHNYPLGAGCDDRLPTDGNTGRFYGCCTKPTRVAATKRMNLNTLPASPFDVCCHNSIFSRQHQRGGLHSSSRLQYRLVLAATERIELKFPPFRATDTTSSAAKLVTSGDPARPAICHPRLFPSHGVSKPPLNLVRR